MKRRELLSVIFGLGLTRSSNTESLQQDQRVFELFNTKPRSTRYSIPQDESDLLKIPAEELQASARIEHYSGGGLMSIQARRQVGPVGPSDLEIRLRGRPLEVRNAYRLSHDSQVPKPLLDAEYAANEIASRLSDVGYFNHNMEIVVAPSTDGTGAYALLARTDSRLTARMDTIRIGSIEYNVRFEAEMESEGVVKTGHNNAEVEANKVRIGLIKYFVLKSIPTDQNPAEANINYIGPGNLTLLLDDRLNSTVIDINVGAGFRTSYPEVLAKLREVERIISPADFINTLYNSLKDKRFYFGRDTQFLKVE